MRRQTLAMRTSAAGAVFATAALLVGVLATSSTATAASGSPAASSKNAFGGFKHIVVIYEENHSFDNLYGGWEGVNGLANADPAHTLQKNEAGNVFACLKQNDANLQAPSPLAATCSDVTPGTPGGPFVSHFTNAPFTIDDYITPSDTTCPPNPLVALSSPGGHGC